jgi:hypothetical protein
MRAIKLLVATAVVAVGVLAANAALSNGPAKAHAAIHCETTVYHPTDNSWTCASGPAGWYHACDYHVDGHRVRGHIDVTGSEHDRYTAWAPSQGCSEWAGVQYGGLFIERIKTCTEGEGCSGWKRVH